MYLEENSISRHIVKIAQARLTETPVLLLEGARSVGKSTAMRDIVDGQDVVDFDLDSVATFEGLQLDSSAILGHPKLVCIDEYQKMPTLLDEIKSQLNSTSKFGQFLMTGSTRQESLPLTAQSLTGRIQTLQILPLAQCEIHNTRPDFITSLLSKGEVVFDGYKSHKSRTKKEDYIEKVVKGGFPLSLKANDERARARWFRDYLRLILERDSQDIARVNNKPAFKRTFNQLAANTSAILNINKIAEQNEINHHTAQEYVSILENLFLVKKLPAWGKLAMTGVTNKPKVHIVDSGIAAHTMRLNQERLLSDDLTYRTEFGHLLESFVAGEILKEISWQDEEFTVGHWRSLDKKEVDLVVENEEGKIVAVEVKASTMVREADFAGLDVLRARAGGRLAFGILFYEGDRILKRDDATYAVPIDVLWQSL